MNNLLKKIFYPPTFENDSENNQRAVYLNIILWAIVLLVGSLLIVSIAQGISLQSGPSIVMEILLAITLALLVVMRFGYIKIASFLLSVLAWLVLVNRAKSSSGVHDTAFIASLITILLAGLLLDFRYSLGLTVATLAAGWWMASLEANGLLIPESDPPLAMMQEFTVIFSLIVLIYFITRRGYSTVITQAKNSSVELAKTNAELIALQSDLEKSINERTEELESVSLQMVRRAEQLASIAEIAKVVASVRDLDSLFKIITNAITEQFGFYHTGIFMLQNNEYAVLRAASSQGGQDMLKRGHRLKIGAEGIVGYVAFTGQPRIALDTGADAIFFNNPDLPLTHSEIAVPLQVGNKVIGVLDVQSEKQNAFGEEDISIISTLANQVAVAIENANLFDETSKALKESQAAYRKFVRSGWADLARRTDKVGYRYSNGKFEPLFEAIADEHIHKAIEEGITINASGQEQVLAVPVMLRNEVIGAIKIQPKAKDQALTTPEDLTAINAIANRAALALENARLINTSQKRAAQEQAVAEISSQISSASKIESILQTAVGELGKRIDSVEVLIKLDSAFTEE